MKRLLIMCILIVNIIFISGCTSEEKTNSETSTYSQSSSSLIDPRNLVDGYYSYGYETFAKTIEDSFISKSLEYSGGSSALYEGEVPKGKKRVLTSFKLLNEDQSIYFDVKILEFDSIAPFEELISIYKLYIPNFDRIDTSDLHEKRNLVGDNSYQYTLKGESRSMSGIFFTINNRVVKIDGQGASEKNIEAETLKIAKAIEGKID